MDSFNIGRGSLTIILFISTLSLIGGSNIDCNGKAFHCVNSTHFKICVDLGGGVSTTVDEFLIPCPKNTVCRQSNLLECEYELMTTPSPATVQDEVTNEQFQKSENSGWKQMEITTSFPMKKQQNVEFSEKYDQVNETPASFTAGFLTSAVKDPVTSSNRELHASGKSNFNKTLHISRRIDRELTLSSIDLGVAVTQNSPLNTLVAEVVDILSVSKKGNFPSNESQAGLLNFDEPVIERNPNNNTSRSLLGFNHILPFTKAVTESVTYNNIDDSSSTINILSDAIKINIKNETRIVLNGFEEKVSIKKVENVSDLNSSLFLKKTIIPINTTSANYNSILNVMANNNSFIVDTSPTLTTRNIFSPDYSSISKSRGSDNRNPNAQKSYEIEIIKNKTLPELVIMTLVTNLANSNSVTTLKTDITTEIPNKIKSLKFPKLLRDTVGTDPANNNITTTEIYNKISTTTSNRVTSLKPILDLVPNKETLPEPFKDIVATSLDSNNITITGTNNNIRTIVFNRITSSKQITDLIPNNETRLELFKDTVATDLDNNNITITEKDKNITFAMSNRVTSLQPISDLIPNIENRPEPLKDTVATGLDNNNITRTETHNITRTISNGVMNLKPLSDLIPNNETLPEPFKDTVATNLENNNITTTEAYNNLKATMSNIVTSLKPLSDLISNNETLPESFKDTVAIGLDNNNNITTTETYNNIKTTMFNTVTSLKSISDLIPNNETLTDRFKDTVATDLDNNNITITEKDKNITIIMSNRVTSLQPISDLIPNIENRLEPFKDTVATDLDNNNITKTETNNITRTKSNIVTSLKPLLDLIPNNETLPEPFKDTVATNLDNNNITTTKAYNNLKTTISNKVTSLKSISDLIPNNETLPEPFKDTVATNLDNNNITTTKAYNNLKTTIYNKVTSLKPISDFTSNNETRLEPFKHTVATNLDNNNNIKITETDNNIVIAMSNIVTSLKPISELISNNETFPEPFQNTVVIDLDNNNITITETQNNITTAMFNRVTSLNPIPNLNPNNETFTERFKDTVNTDLNINNITTTETIPGNNITTTISNRVTGFKLISDPIKENEFDTTSIILPDHQYWNESAVNLSTRIEILDNIFRTTQFNTTNSLGSISSTEPILNDLERNIASISTSLPISLNKLTTLNNRSLGAHNINSTHNVNDTKSVTNSFYGINEDLSYNSTVRKMNNEFEYNYETRRESDTPAVTIKSITNTHVFEFANSMDVTNNTFTVVGVLSEYEVVSDNNKILKNISKLESTMTSDTPTRFDLNYTSNKDMISSKIKTVTTMSLESDIKEMYEQVNFKNSSNNVQILIKNNIGNSNLTELSTENIPVTKLITPNNPSLSATLDVSDVTDKIDVSFSKSEINYYHVKNNLSENSLTTNVISTDINNTDKNVASSVFNNSKSIPLKYLHSTLSNQLLKNIYNVSNNNVSENISLILSTDNTTAPNKQHVTEYSIPNLTNKNKEVMTTVKQVNDTLRRELSYSSIPSMVLRNNVSYDFIVKNITSNLADRNSEPKHNYDTKGGGFNERNNITNDKHVVDVNNNVNSSKLADYFHLSQIPKSQLSGNAIKRMIVQDQVNNTRLQIENENLSSITDRKNIRKIGRIHNVNNLNSSNKFSVDNINNWRDVNATLVVNDIEISIRTKKNYTNDFNVISELSTTTSNLLRKTSSQTYLIKNETEHEMSANVLEFSIIPSNKSSQSNKLLDILKMKMRPVVSNKTTLKLIREQDIIPISEDIETDVTEKKLGNSYGHPELLTSISNGVTKNMRQNTQNNFTTPTTNINYFDSQYRRLKTNLEFSCTKRGKFSNANDCNKFYICIGKVEPIIGVCPIHTVFSEFLKQCTRNVTHCIRKNQFKCTAAGRFNKISSNNTYFICAKTKSGFTRFTLQCQKGYYLDKNNIKCTPLLTNISISDENSSKNSKESFDKSKEMERISVIRKNYFECENEGKFKDPQDCRRYYVCKKGRKSTFRRKIKQCDSDEVFHKKKKQCVDMESYECDI